MSPDPRQTQFILDSIPSFVFLKDTSNRILRVNQAVVDSLGVSRDQIEGRLASEVYPEDADRFYEDDLAVIQSGRPKTGYPEKAGDRWIRTDKIPVRDDDGEITRLLVIATDMTESKLAEQAQQEAYRLLSVAGRMAAMGGWDFDVRSGDLSWSEQVCLIHDVPVGHRPTLEEAIGYYLPESREVVEGLVQRAMATGEPWDAELEIRTEKGRHAWVRAIGEAEFVDGECVKLWGTFQDITEHRHRDLELKDLNRQLTRRAKEAEEARQKAVAAEAELAQLVAKLSENEERYRTLFERSPVMHANVSPDDGTIKDCNRTLVRTLGYRDKSELIGNPIVSLYCESCEEQVKKAFNQFVETGEVTNESLTLKTQSGDKIPVILNVASVRDSAGRILYSSSTWSDVTELTQANHDLREFAYVASHDLKAPLRAISHLATWLEDDLKDTLEASSAQHLAQLKQRVGRMDRLLDDLLTYSRAGRSGGQIKRVDLADLINDVAMLHGAVKPFVICLNLTAREIEINETPFETVLRNLVSNAIKHHDGDRIRLEITARVVERHLEVCVSDNGPGIPTELRERAFRMFQTLKPRDEVEGSGMGLAIAKRMIESHRGAIDIESAEPRGTRIRFTWSLEQNSK